MNRFRAHPWLAVSLWPAVVLVIASCASTPPPPPEEKPAPTVHPLPEAEMARSRQMRDLIARYALDAYAPEAFRQAETRFGEGESLYSRENDRAKTALEEASRGYQAVIDRGFPLLTDERQESADASRSEADALKAAVALKDAYAAARALYEQAEAAEAAGRYAEAVDGYTQARSRFEELAVTARQKKELAEQSLLSSRETLLRAEQRALEAQEAQSGLQGEGL
jgi:hypothetical protein